MPEWQTVGEAADFGTLLLELYAYMGDILNFYIDRTASEAFLATAVRPQSVLYIADMLGYTPDRPAGGDGGPLRSRSSPRSRCTGHGRGRHASRGTRVYTCRATPTSLVVFELIQRRQPDQAAQRPGRRPGHRDRLRQRGHHRQRLPLGHVATASPTPSSSSATRASSSAPSTVQTREGTRRSPGPTSPTSPRHDPPSRCSPPSSTTAASPTSSSGTTRRGASRQSTPRCSPATAMASGREPTTSRPTRSTSSSHPQRGHRRSSR